MTLTPKKETRSEGMSGFFYMISKQVHGRLSLMDVKPWCQSNVTNLYVFRIRSYPINVSVFPSLTHSDSASDKQDVQASLSFSCDVGARSMELLL